MSCVLLSARCRPTRWRIARGFVIFHLAVAWVWGYSQSASGPYLATPQQKVVGVGGKLRLTGRNLGSLNTAVVVFGSSLIATRIERHRSDEIVVRVPVGASSGAVCVVTGVDAGRLRLAQIERTALDGATTPADVARAEVLDRRLQSDIASGMSSVGRPVVITAAYVKAPKRDRYGAAHGIPVVKGRLVVDLADYYGLDAAIEIADRHGLSLAGYLPVTNSFVFDAPTPLERDALYSLGSRLLRDRRVREFWLDIGLGLKQVTFVDADVVDRYRHRYIGALGGREDVYATDRVQAPAAWNLIERFNPGGRGGLSAVKVAVLDTGCDQTHAELAGVDLKKVVTNELRLKIAGREVILPDAGAFNEIAYADGDVGSQHGTRVISLIGARNANVLDATESDRGINGMLHNPMPYTIQVYQGSRFEEEYDPNFNFTLTEFLAVMNAAAITNARIMNASWGQSYPINPATSAYRHEVRSALRKLAHQLNQFSDRLLLVVAAGNEAVSPDPEGMNGRITPFEDLNLNNQLDAGEDFDGDGQLGHGNYIAASLGTLPNVLTVGATGGPVSSNGSHDDQRADFSNWGIPVMIAAPGVDVLCAGGSPAGFLIGGSAFRKSNGTSFATPLTCGAAALLKALRPALTPAQLKTLLLGTGFEVRTLTGTGAVMDWQTLKAGFAVRQVLLDRGLITNDQEWTGVSKVITEGGKGLVLSEVRRGPGGRAQAFATRTLGVGGAYPTLRQDGRWVAYYSLNAAGLPVINILRFDLGGEITVVGPVAPPFTLGSYLDYSPQNHLLWNRWFTSKDECTRRIEVFVLQPDLVTNTLIADTGEYNTCAFDEGGNPIPWQFYALDRAIWRPDGRMWEFNYTYAEGVGGMTNQSCPYTWWRNNPYPAASVPFPGCSEGPYILPAWAPDGRAQGGGWDQPPMNIRTDFYNNAHGTLFTHIANPVNAFRWCNWSPDGSEFGFTEFITFFSLSTIRRDYRDTADRAKLVVMPLSGATFTWGW